MPKEPVPNGRGAGGDMPKEPFPNGTSPMACWRVAKLKARPVVFPYNGQL